MKIPLQPLAAANQPASPPPHGWPLLRLGFRPFYLGAALFACLSVPLWVLLFLGQLAWAPVAQPLLWHAHEMLFGFAAAVVVGFLLTAGKAWTGLATPRGAPLALLVLLWLGARLAALFAPYPVYAALDLLLLPAVAAILVSLLLRAGNRRNLPLAALLGLLALANLAFHLSVLGLLDLPPVRALYAALALIVLIESVMAGRVVPAFTMNAIPGLRLKAHPRLDAATLLVSALALGLWVAAAPGPVVSVALGLACLLQLQRLWGWQPWRTRGRPILWILHLAYAWIPVGFGLLAIAELGWATPSAGVHALAVGATGGLIIGMVTRTARGHTGRPLQVSPTEVAAYALVMLAAVLRSLVPLAAPQYLVASVAGAALAWSLAFALYLAVFTPWLLGARQDGKDG